MKKRSNPPPPSIDRKPPPPPAPPRVKRTIFEKPLVVREGEELEIVRNERGDVTGARVVKRRGADDDELCFKVQARMCATCIYRPDSTLNLKKLEADVADPNMEGFFVAYRECHHAKRNSKVCCRGFWNAHKDHFTAGQLAQRLDIVRFVDVDVMPESTQRIKRDRRQRRAKARRNR